jgi:hypothetical protein
MIIWMDLLNPWVLLFVGLGAYLVFKKPLLGYGFPRPLELALATTCFLIYVFHFSAVVVVPFIQAQSLVGEPCLPPAPELRCYSLSQVNCQSAWSHFEKTCHDEALHALDPHRLTTIIGPGVKQCIYKRMDSAFHSTRRIASDDEMCQKFFSQIDHPSP